MEPVVSAQGRVLTQTIVVPAALVTQALYLNRYFYIFQEFFYGLSLWYRRASQRGEIDHL